MKIFKGDECSLGASFGEGNRWGSPYTPRSLRVWGFKGEAIMAQTLGSSQDTSLTKAELQPLGSS